MFSASTLDTDVPVLLIKDDCISCSNNKEQIVHAFKLACLN